MILEIRLVVNSVKDSDGDGRRSDLEKGLCSFFLCISDMDVYI